MIPLCHQQDCVATVFNNPWDCSCWTPNYVNFTSHHFTSYEMCHDSPVEMEIPSTCFDYKDTSIVLFNEDPVILQCKSHGKPKYQWTLPNGDIVDPSQADPNANYVAYENGMLIINEMGLRNLPVFHLPVFHVQP